MTDKSQKLFVDLDQSLDDLIKVYRSLLNTIRNEKEILISSNLEELEKSNKSKETILLKVRKMDEARQKVTKELAESEGLDPEVTRLLDFAKHFGGEEGDRLRKLHSVLDLLLTRIQEINQNNEVLVKVALDNVTGGISNIRDSLSENKVYKKGGAVQSTPAESGQLVRRQI